MVVCILYPGFKFLLVSPRSTVFSSVWPCQQSSWARNLSVIRPSSVCVAIISEPVEHIPFKFQLWLPLGLSEGGNGHFWKKITFSDCLWTFQLFVNIRPYGSQNFKALFLPQIGFESFQTFFLNFLLTGLHKSTAFLALLDYVSRVHEIEIRTSCVRLWHRLSLKLLHGFLSNFSCGFPWAICPDFFFLFIFDLFFNFFKEYFSFSLTWNPMGAKTSKRYSSLKSLLHSFNLSWIFLSVVLTKVLFGIF